MRPLAGSLPPGRHRPVTPSVRKSVKNPSKRRFPGGVACLAARPQEENLLLDGFRAAGLPLCASDADLAGIATVRRLAECTAPR
jgi:hypothetical protein